MIDKTLLGGWSIGWIISTLSLPADLISTTPYPEVYKWEARFKEVSKVAESAAPKPVRLEDAAVIPLI